MTTVQQLYNLDNLSKQRKDIVAKYHNGPVKNKTDDWENPQYSIYAITDYYGFIHDGGMTPEFLEKESRIKRLDCKREAKWRKLLVTKKSISKSSRSNKLMGSDLMFSNIPQKMNDSNFREEITKRIYKGIPQQFKSSIWHVFLDVGAMKSSKPKVYQNMLKKALDKSPDVQQIDIDVNRTFRNTTYFRERYNDRQKALLHVLAAYSMYNTEIGYCQGMSEIAGLLLMYLVEEEDVFWGLSQLMTSSRYCMHGIFVVGFPRLLTFFNHLNNITHKLLPKISKHFEKLEVMASSYALKWFMQCYLDRVPLTLFLRLWDIFLLEGEKLLIAMAYNILKMHKKRLIKMDHSSILQFFQNDLRKDFLYDDDLVIESLKTCIEELKRHKLSVPSPPQNNELPCRPFGTDADFHTPSPKAVKERQLAQSNPSEAIRRSLKKSPNKDFVSQNSVTKTIVSRSNSEDKDRPTSRPISNQSAPRPKRDSNGTQTNERSENSNVPSHIRYRITNKTNSSQLSKSRSLHLIEENGDTRASFKQNAAPPESRSLTKSAPDLSKQNFKPPKKLPSKPTMSTSSRVMSNSHSLEVLNISSDKHLIVEVTEPSNVPINGGDCNAITNHLSNSISKSKTTSTLYSIHQTTFPRSATAKAGSKRRPISVTTSPETTI